MLMSVRFSILFALGLAIVPVTAFAQELTPYGDPIKLEQARKLIAAAEAEAVKQKWPEAIAIVDGSGHLVAFAKMDNTQLGSIEVALEKAKCAALFRRSTKVFEDGLAKGGENFSVLKVPGAIPIEGGLPIIVDGKIIGAIGVSGVKPNEDGQVAKAGLDALKPKP
jgi:glc operon protein GlcG